MLVVVVVLEAEEKEVLGGEEEEVLGGEEEEGSEEKEEGSEVIATALHRLHCLQFKN